MGETEPTTANDDPEYAANDGEGVEAEAEFAKLSTWFGANLKIVRESREESQTSLAKKMSARGFPFHQTTISRIEAGERPVQLGEAYALATVLGTSVDQLVSPSEQTILRQFARRILDDLNVAENLLEELIEFIWLAQHELLELRIKGTRFGMDDADFEDPSREDADDDGRGAIGLAHDRGYDRAKNARKLSDEERMAYLFTLSRKLIRSSGNAD